MRKIHAGLAVVIALVSLVAVPATASADAQVSGTVSGNQGVSHDTAVGKTRPLFVPGQVIVRFHNATTATRRSDAIRALDANVARRLPLPHTELLDLSAGSHVRAAVQALRNRAGVAYAQPNFIRQATAIPNDSSFSSLWGLNNTGQAVNGSAGTLDADIDAPEAWDSETGDASAVVGVVDTGVDYNHPDLAGNLWSNPGETPGNGVDDDGNGKIDDLHGWDFVSSDNAPLDENGHGTHVAGTIGAQGNNGIGTTGVAWDVSLMAVRVLNANGSGTDAGVAAGFVYAAQSGADVVNASLSGPGASPVLNDAVTSNPGTLYVVAAGNDSANNDSSARFPCDIPASNLICVAASDQNDQLAGFSNYGISNVDLAAPGTNIYSAYPGNTFTFLQGTSMATPHVSGGAALLFSAKPSATVAEVRSALLSTVDPKPSFNDKVATGGRLNANAGLQALSPFPPPDTTITSGPSGTTNDSNPRFGFISTKADSNFQCEFDGGAWTACISPYTSTALADGAHAFYVRAIDSAGRVDPDPATRSFNVDTEAPDTAITSGPAGPTKDPTPLFRFSATEPRATFSCKVDSDPYAPCRSPRGAARRLADGFHTFYVKATDQAGNIDSTPAHRRVRVDTHRPASIASARASAHNSPFVVKYTASDPSPSTGLARVELWAHRPGQAGYSKVATDWTPRATRSFSYEAAARAGTYRFYTRAGDKVGNYEAPPAAPDASTVIRQG